jgi:hypothetical protein
VNREDWLHGWTRQGRTVLVGVVVRCAGCGRYQGAATVAYPKDWTPPGPVPDWPFEEETCPVHLSFTYVGRQRQQVIRDREKGR